MKSDRIKDALRGATDTKDFIEGTGSLYKLPSSLSKYFTSKKSILIQDENTYKAAGKKVEDILRNAGFIISDTMMFRGYPILHADYENVLKIKERLRNRNTVAIAIGSGTINDLVKRAVFECEMKYALVATASSVDGYSSFGSSIVKNGFKHTLPCSAPLIIIADTDVLRNAPHAMTAAGYGDLIGKYTAGADWLLADELSIDPIDPFAWTVVQDNLDVWTGDPEKLLEKDRRAFELLFEGLTMTGFAMQFLQRSRPVSGSEHLLSHVWEMKQFSQKERVPGKNEVPSHGFKVAVGTVVCTGLMETILRRSWSSLKSILGREQVQPWKEREVEIRDAFYGLPGMDRLLEEAKAKHLSKNELEKRIESIGESWPNIQNKMTEILLPFDVLKIKLKAAGCPSSVRDIGFSKKSLVQTIKHAQMIRNRYTVLDLAYELGILEECIGEMLEKYDV